MTNQQEFDRLQRAFKGLFGEDGPAVLEAFIERADKEAADRYFTEQMTKTVLERTGNADLARQLSSMNYGAVVDALISQCHPSPADRAQLRRSIYAEILKLDWFSVALLSYFEEGEHL